MIEKSLILAADFVSKFEGFMDHIYICPAGHQTFGYGSLVANYPHMTFPITIVQAKKCLKLDLNLSIKYLDQYVDAPLNINQTTALLSFIYNVGSENFRNSTLLKYLNQNKYINAADQFLLWDIGGGKVLPGLVIRRKAERELFLKPVEEI